MDGLGWIQVGAGAALIVGGVAFALQRWATTFERGGVVDRGAWQAFGLDHGLKFTDTGDLIKLTGMFLGHPVTISARITQVRTRTGTAQVATTTFRAPIRGRLPPGLLIRQRDVANRFRSLVERASTIETGDPRLDAALIVSGADAADVAGVVQRPEIRATLTQLFDEVPGVVVHERAVELEASRMVNRPADLVWHLERLTRAAEAFGAIAPSSVVPPPARVPPPRVEVGSTPSPAPPRPSATPLPASRVTPAPVTRSLPFSDVPNPPSGVTLVPGRPPGAVPLAPSPATSPTPTPAPTPSRSTPAPAPSSSPFPEPTHDPPSGRQPLHLALRGLTGASQATIRQRLNYLKMPPYTYEIEVRSVSEATSRTGAPTGGLRVNGVLTRARWRAELTFPKELAYAAETLIANDVITGECLLDDLRGIADVVELTAQSPPRRVPPDQRHNGTEGGDPT